GRSISFQPQPKYLYGGANYDTLDYFGAAFVGLVVFFLVFGITIVSFLNERSQGTLERLMASPLRRGEIVVGYMLGFTVLALVQAAEVLIFALAILRIHNEGSVLLIFGMEALMAIAAVNLGIFLSMFARSEFQAVQFIPLVVVPQVLLSGIIFPVSTEPTPLQWLSDVLGLAWVPIDPPGQHRHLLAPQAGYVCLNCGAPAVDLGEVPAELEAEARADEATYAAADVLCPVCETMVQLGVDMECPNCGSPL